MRRDHVVAFLTFGICMRTLYCSSANSNFCFDKGLEELPEILVYSRGEIIAYYSQSHDMDDLTYEALLHFLTDLNERTSFELNPKFGEINVRDCCESLLISGELIGDTFGIYHRSDDTKFGNVHYLNTGSGYEVFFNQLQFHLGFSFKDSKGNVLNIITKRGIKTADTI